MMNIPIIRCEGNGPGKTTRLGYAASMDMQQRQLRAAQMQSASEAYDKAYQMYNAQMSLMTGSNNVFIGYHGVSNITSGNSQCSTYVPKTKRHWSLRLVGMIARIISIPFAFFDCSDNYPNVKKLDDTTREIIDK